MTLETPNLFDVPKDRPTAKERLREFKERHDIWTYGGKFAGWSALLVQRAREWLHGYPNTGTAKPIELIVNYCRLLEEEAFLLVTADTEREAIEELCRLNKIPFNP